jgi:hypothetical protein
MANISDSAGIFTGGALELFNEMQRVVGRDGDVTYARREMLEAMKRVTQTTQLPHSVRDGAAVAKRNP